MQTPGLLPFQHRIHPAAAYGKGLGTRLRSTRLGSALRFAACAAAVAFLHLPAAEAARCAADSKGNWSCTYQERDEVFNANNGAGSCSNVAVRRHVRWQVPEGTPPAGGWDTVFYYNGTVSAVSSLVNPFSAKTTDNYGFIYLPQVFHELLDDPRGTGRKYAVIAAEAPTVFGMQFWDTNSVNPYTSSGDYCFLPDLFNELAAGNYGPASQYNLNRRFAFGISSGGYNTSRMAVTFNNNSTWKALGIVSASYATCSGSNCYVPKSLPANHPPTKFWHGTADTTVPIWTMRQYHSQLQSQGIATEKLEHSQGHQFTADHLGPTGVKAWFDRH
jgi:hypothetical protein